MSEWGRGGMGVRKHRQVGSKSPYIPRRELMAKARLFAKLYSKTPHPPEMYDSAQALFRTRGR